MSKPASSDDLPVRRLDRILAFMSIGLIALSVLCFFAIMIASGAGVTNFGEGVWPAVSVVVYYAPILAFILMLTLIIRTFVRRGRANRGA